MQEKEVAARERDAGRESLLERQLEALRAENERWRRTCAELQSDIYGARLSARYMEKELAGRVQQIQILVSNLDAQVRDRLWPQVEAEVK